MKNLSILIVEDESLERNMLVAQVQEAFDCFEHIDSVDNGIQALHMCQEKQPHIVLVDINIPGISGLSLIETLKGFDFQGKIIITTAYDCFEYAKQAIRFGVVEYLLKPINEEELRRSIRMGLEQLSSQPSARPLPRGNTAPVWSYTQTYLIRDLLYGSIPQNALQSLFGWPKQGELQARCLRFSAKAIDDKVQGLFLHTCAALFDADFVALCAVVEQDMVLLLHPRTPMDNACLYVLTYIHALTLAEALLNVGAGSVDVFIGDTTATYESLRDSYRQQHATGWLRTTDGLRIAMTPLHPAPLCLPKERRKLQQKWLQRLREGQLSYILPMLKRALGREGAYWPGAMLLLDALRQLDPTVNLQEVLSILRQSSAFDLLKGWLEAFLAHRTAGEKNALAADHQYSVAQRALRLLRERYGEDLAQSAMADEFGLSQAHFSRLFKQEIGMSFVAMLTQIRMNEAKRMLATNTLVRDVARQCGYLSTKYFMIAFKKEVGCTPAQYQQSLCRKLQEAP